MNGAWLLSQPDTTKRDLSGDAAVRQSVSTSLISATASGSNSESNCRRRGVSAVTSRGAREKQRGLRDVPSSCCRGVRQAYFWPVPGEKIDGGAGCQGTERERWGPSVCEVHAATTVAAPKVNLFHPTDYFSIATHKESPSLSRSRPVRVASTEVQVTLWQPGWDKMLSGMSEQQELPHNLQLFIPWKTPAIRHCEVHVCKILRILLASHKVLGSIPLGGTGIPAPGTA